MGCVCGMCVWGAGGGGEACASCSIGAVWGDCLGSCVGEHVGELFGGAVGGRL